MTELGRRLVHASGAAIPGAYLAGVLTWEQVGWVLSMGLGVALGLEVMRLRRGLDWEIYERLTREYEHQRVAGYALYMVGMAAVGLTAEPWVAVPAMLMLTIADPIGGFLGGGHPGRKPAWVQATVAGTGFLLAFPFTYTAVGALGPAVAIAAAGGIVAALADGNPVVLRGRYVDDNLTIPIGAAIALWLARVGLGV